MGVCISVVVGSKTVVDSVGSSGEGSVVGDSVGAGSAGSSEEELIGGSGLTIDVRVVGRVPGVDGKGKSVVSLGTTTVEPGVEMAELES